MKFNLLLQNRFWLAIGAVVVAYLLFFYFAVYGKWGQIQDKRDEIHHQQERLERIIKQRGPKPTKEWIGKYLKFGTDLKKTHKEILAYYNKMDKPLEGWFKGLELLPDGLPSEGSFMATYRDETEQLIKALERGGIHISEEASGIDLSAEDKTEALGFEEPDKREQFKMLQKRFWIQKELFNAFIKAKIVRCEAIVFQAPTGRPRATRSRGQPASPPGSKIKGDLGIILPFQAQLQLHYQNIPQLIYQLTEASSGGPFVIIQKITVTRVGNELDNYPELMRPSRIPFIEQKPTWQPPEIKPPLVAVNVTGGVLDFDIK